MISFSPIPAKKSHSLNIFLSLSLSSSFLAKITIIQLAIIPKNLNALCMGKDGENFFSKNIFTARSRFSRFRTILESLMTMIKIIHFEEMLCWCGRNNMLFTELKNIKRFSRNNFLLVNFGQFGPKIEPKPPQIFEKSTFLPDSQNLHQMA